MKLNVKVPLFLLLALSAAGCNCGGGAPPIGRSVDISPNSAQVQLGATQAFTATPAEVDWSVEGGEGNGTISTDGVYTAPLAMPAQPQISVVAALKTDPDVRGVATVTLTTDANPVVSIAITPAAVTLSPGAAEQLTLTATRQDNTTQDVTAEASWTSQTPAVATVSAGRVESLSEGTATIQASLGALTANIDVTVTAGPALTSVTVAPATASIARSTSQQFQATANYADGSSRDVTATAAWTSSDASIATVSASGEASGLLAGAVTITAQLSGAQGQAQLTVTDVSLTAIAVTPANVTLPLAASTDLVATGSFSDGSTQDITAQVTWSSSAPNVVTVAASPPGRITSVATGTATVTATLSGRTGQAQVTVTNATLQSITVTPSVPTRAKGLTVQFAATGVYSDQTTLDLTRLVIWSSTDTAVASISNAAGAEGLATTLTAGGTNIRATLGGTVGATTLTVTNATLTLVQLTPATATLPAGATVQLRAEGTFSDGSKQDLTAQATWTSSATSIATVGDSAGQKGLATGIAPGSATVTATVQAVSGTAALTVTDATLDSIAVTPVNPSLAKGTSRPFTATGTYSDSTTHDLTDQVAWTSNDTSIATISNAAPDRGVATGVNAGTATVTAAFGGKSGATQLTVTNATLQSLLVAPATVQVPKGKTQQFTATGTFSDNSTQDLTTQVTWSSNNTASVTISNAAGSEGLATAVAQALSATTLTAVFGGVNDTASMLVTAATLEALVITPDPATVPVGGTRPLTATALYSDGTTRDVTNNSNISWTSSDTAVATVTDPAGFPPSGGGEVTGVAVGTVTITVTLSGKTGTVELTVNTATLQSITVTPANPSLPKNFDRQMRATGNYSDGSTQDLTANVTWASSNTTSATITPAGLVQATATPGTTTITASLTTPNLSGNTTVTVTNVTPTALDVTPASFTLPQGTSRQLTAIATFSDGSTLDVTSQVNWTSSSQQTAVVSTRGVVTASLFLTGNVTITGRIPNTNPAITDSSAVTVVP